MKCPECGSASFVLSTAHPKEGREIKRRRQCFKKGHRFNTYEVADITQATLLLFSQRLANRGFTQEAIENILSLD